MNDQSPSDDQVRAVVAAWRDAEPDDDIRVEIDELSSGSIDVLRERFTGGLTFGTAGLRAAIGAGPRRMNRLVVRRAAAGLVDRLRSDGGDVVERGLVVGWDARRKSREFALDTARVAAARGMKVFLMPHEVPTPVLAWNITRLGCAAGVMVTASHNPPSDNGYKVYLGTGAQIVPPVDVEIAAAIDALDPTQIPLASVDDPLIVRLDDSVIGDYLQFVPSVALVPRSQLAGVDVTVAYTALHGVGGDVVRSVLESHGGLRLVVVESQQKPDGTFPGVSFPNPEEPGAMDAVIELGRRVDADVALANDPDADRLGVAIPTSDGSWRRLAGDEIGWLFADHVLAHTSGSDRLIVSTLVSSSLVGRMVREAGVHFEESYTGFKWIADVARRFPDERLVFAYEQALGYLVGGDPLDKDGIGAALVMVEIARLAESEGTTIEGRLDDIARRFGRYRTSEISIPMSPDEGARVVAAFRTSPPSDVVGRSISSIEDHPEASLVRVHLAGPNSVRVQIRPSGTEPKVKLYGEAIDLDPEPFLLAVRDHLVESS
ncbi:MAG: phosphoglucomutase [Actinomycetota bacterium]